MGDWNELFSEGWIGTLSCLFGGHQADMSSFSTTRWEWQSGDRLPGHQFWLRWSWQKRRKNSDHIILDFNFTVGAAHLRSTMQKRFVIVDCFTRPLWLTPLKWQENFWQSSSDLLEWKLDWGNFFCESWFDWDSTQVDEALEQNKAVDYEWSLVCSMLTSALRIAYLIALPLIDGSYSNHEEMKRVTHHANHRWIKGASVKTIDNAEESWRG